ncbi:hypothetical protein, partial [Colwellia sp. Bg11-12]|uniref:hypothetical protein n=1 Tax=Colwellia sp. Bg11-12 TaxID=2759817 RepID=UPI001C714637
ALYVKESPQMELNSMEDVKAIAEFQKIEQLQRIEKKLHRLSFTPLYAAIMIIIYNIWSIWFVNNYSTPMNHGILAIIVIGVCRSNVERTDLLRQLFELKYGK